MENWKNIRFFKKRDIVNSNLWHVNRILFDILKVDAKLNLPPEMLVAPKEEDWSPPPGGGGGGGPSPEKKQNIDGGENMFSANN